MTVMNFIAQLSISLSSPENSRRASCTVQNETEVNEWRKKHNEKLETIVFIEDLGMRACVERMQFYCTSDVRITRVREIQLSATHSKRVKKRVNENKEKGKIRTMICCYDICCNSVIAILCRTQQLIGFIITMATKIHTHTHTHFIFETIKSN